jgi:hypothetical protein
VIADDGEAGMLEGIFTGSLAAGDDKARDIVGAARAGLVEAIVTAAITLCWRCWTRQTGPRASRHGR